MNIKKLFIILSSLVIFSASAFTVYFMYMSSLPVPDGDVLAAGVKSVGYEDRALITANTEIVKRIRYSKGIPVAIDTVEAAGAENLGMNKNTAEEYYKKDGYLIVEFNDKKVVMLKELQQWPPNYYIIKEDEGIINISYTDEHGNLNFLKTANLEIESLPQEDQIDLNKGRAFKSLEEIESMIEEYDS